MRSAGPQKIGGLCVAFLVACGDGTASTPDGSTPADSGAGGVQGTAGVQGTGGVLGRGGVQGTGGTAGAPSTGGTGGSGGAVALSFAADIWPVFDKVRQPAWTYYGSGSYDGCTTNGVCHGGASPGARLSMIDSNTAYAALLNVASVTSLCAAGGGTTRVIPGDPDGSCLVMFYEGRLKNELQWVDQAEIDLVRRWIAEGARP